MISATVSVPNEPNDSDFPSTAITTRTAKIRLTASSLILSIITSICRGDDFFDDGCFLNII